MTEVPDQTQGRATDTGRKGAVRPRSGGSQARFNPLHPSMELPPEQLIRLLGLEAKTGRARRKAPPPPAGNDAGALTAKRTTLSASELPRMEIGARERNPRRRAQAHTPARRGTSPLLLATGMGVIAGAVVAAYLLLGQPPRGLPATSPSQVTTATPPEEKVTTGNQPTPSPALAPQNPSPATPTADPVAPPPALGDNSRWEAVVQAQEQRLQAAAAQRFSQRLRLHDNGPETGPKSDDPAQGEQPLF